MPVEKSPFYEPFLKMPSSIGAEVQEELRAEARTVIKDDVIQSFKDLGESTVSVYVTWLNALRPCSNFGGGVLDSLSSKLS